MERFAKLFETPTTQVLVQHEYDAVKEKFLVKIRMMHEGCIADVSGEYPGNDEGEAASKKAFDAYSQKHAEQHVYKMRKVFHG